MKWFILSLALMAGFLFIACGGNADDFDFSDDKDDRGITITGYRGSDTNLHIPRRIKRRTVTSIGSYALANKDLFSVGIPSTVINIGSYAFANNNITSIHIPSSVAHIGIHAFANNELTRVDIPDSTRYIGDGAFAFNMITDISLPQGVDISLSSFYASVYDQYMQKGQPRSRFNLSLYSESDYDIAVLDSFAAEIIKYHGNVRNVRIPEQIAGYPVTSIGIQAFSAKQLTGVTIPNSIILIGDGAFNSNELQRVVIPNTVTMIGNLAFGDNRLTAVTISNTAFSIGDDAFRNNRLTALTIPASVNLIGNGAFGVNRLTSVIVPNSVEFLSESAFDPNVRITRR
jgi:hypothetical protein